MQNNDRMEKILRIINQKGSVDIRTLSELTYASASTIRRDLDKLESMGCVRRHHGGAESVLSLRPPRIIRSQHNQAEKAAAASKAVRFVTGGSTIFLDESTTVQYMIPLLAGVRELTVVTNGADTAMRLADAKIRAVCTGGELFAESMAYVGAAAADMVRNYIFDAVFFSSAGFDDAVISDWSESETVFRRILLRQAKKRYFLADPTKRGQRFTHIVCDVGEVDEILLG